MPMIHKGALLLVFMFLSSALFADTIVITPEAFNRMIETSSDILDEYYEYSKEIENQKYKRQVDLFEKPSEDLVDRQMRDFLGWVKPNEVIYLEKSERALK